MGNTKKAAARKIGLVLGCMLLIILIFLAYRAFFCPIGEGISIGGVDLSGLSAMDARKNLSAALADTLYAQPLTVELPEGALVLPPEEVSVNETKAVRDALHLSSDAADRTLSLLPYLTVNEESIRKQLSAYAQSYDTTLTQPTYRLEGEAPALGTDVFDETAPMQTLVVTVGIPELHLDVHEAYGNILAAYNDAISLIRENAFTVRPEVQPEALPEKLDADALFAELSVEAVNDSLDRETFAFLHGSYGMTFDRDALAAQLEGAEYGETITLPMKAVAPAVIGEDTYYQDVLGEYQTKHTDNQNRNTNLTLLCAALDGHVVQPGEEFSFNGVVGERTAERGYMPAPAYSGTRLVDQVGGGVCQGSTTLYNCVLLADLEVVFRACHGAKVGYVPLGLDASVNWLTTDFKFKNNWNFPIKLQAEVSDGYVKMKILGTDEKDYYIKMTAGQGEDDVAWYARSWKNKYDKKTDELISKETEAFSTYYKNIG
ncbi:MAG: VanW family protein [Oscillospiraceae bacterium]|nr:VanW family protein [Oscillospiraceae bacterium]